MAKILINDGLSQAGIDMLTQAGHEVVTTRIEQDKLPAELPAFDAITVRSATKVRQDLIDVCPNLKVIGRGGVGLDNIDVAHAESKGVKVVNTPAASSRSVAELVFGHIFNISRFLHQANRAMPTEGNSAFKTLKKSYSKGLELQGKTMGVIGFGRIGREVGKMAVGLGMQVVCHDMIAGMKPLTLELNGQSVDVAVENLSLHDLLKTADVISIHVPSVDKPILDTETFKLLKSHAIIVNTSRGQAIEEGALLDALANDKIKGAGLDVFINEPTPNQALLDHPKISVTPHIGASTGEAQANIGTELAEKLIECLG